MDILDFARNALNVRFNKLSSDFINKTLETEFGYKIEVAYNAYKEKYEYIIYKYSPKSDFWVSIDMIPAEYHNSYNESLNAGINMVIRLISNNALCLQ